ncbi:nuclear transport factor 2 family protein [Streptomyces sp. NPDC091292]|uniref:nuclear transport factor 2 family protein n=1 Tax=Streptomyces sp. NPDC091292 TaxID=3365991 RepID=UPI0037F6848B
MKDAEAAMPNNIADLMYRNLLDVFNERDPARRALAVSEIYAEDVVWHEPDKDFQGREALADRAAQVQEEMTGWVFQPSGPVSVNHDIGHLAFHFGPADLPAAVTGMDIARCEDGVIVELYTFVNASGDAA